MEPRYQLDKDSICYGCKYFKAAESLDYKPDIEDVECGGYCVCAEPCFAGSMNEQD